MTVSELRELLHHHRVIYDGLLAGDLARVVAYRRFTGEEYQSSVADVLLHLALHGAHHRGQLATHVSSRGVTPLNTDFVQFCLLNGL